MPLRVSRGAGAWFNAYTLERSDVQSYWCRGETAVSERASGGFAAPHGPLGPLSGFLERFRRSAGVPAIVGGDAASELAAVFAALDQLELEAEELRAHSSAAAARHEHELEEKVERIVLEARGRAGSERDEILRSRLGEADREATEMVAHAEAAAKRIRQTGEERLPDFVAEVLALVREAGS